MTRRLILTAALLGGLLCDAGAQTPTGGIVGRVVDGQTGTPISAAAVEVVGLRTGTLTGVDGRYVLTRIPAGTLTLRVSSIGFAAKTVTGITITEGAIIEQDIVLETAAVQLATLEVTAAAERGTVNRALDQQRTATGIVNAVTAEQISRSPDSDAAQAVQRVSGVTVQDNKFVTVRGLGERYTTTSLNGARIPSPEPEKKIVPLDLFPSNLLESVTTSKTFTPDQPGDFSGAQVDIKTREFPAGRRQSLSTSVSFNDAVTGKTLLRAPNHGTEWLGFGISKRALPSGLRALENFNNVSPAQAKSFIQSFNREWSAGTLNARPNSSFSASVGGNEPVFGHQMGYVVSGTYRYGYEVRADEIRARPKREQGGTTVEIDRFTGSTGRTSVLWGGVANLSTLLGASSRLALNTTYNRSAENEAREEVGTLEDRGGNTFQATRLRYVERSVASAQLLGEHELAARHRFTWSATGSRVTRDEPDRAEFLYFLDRDQNGNLRTPTWFSSDHEGAVRTFADLDETSFEGGASYRLALGSGLRHQIKFGGLFRATERDAFNRAYSITAPNLARPQLELPPEEIFGSLLNAAAPGEFRLNPESSGGSYTASDQLLAGYLMAEYAMSECVRVIAGARVENSSVKVATEQATGGTFIAEPGYTDVLPGLAVNLQLSERQNLRLSASQTLSRPEYRELAPVIHRDVIGGDNVFGNANLVRTLVRNVDARWELYPNSGEILSIALFAKAFDDPIERIYLGTTSTPLVSFYNAKRASNYGVELEARKGLGFLGEPMARFAAFANATIMRSEIVADSATISGLRFQVNTDRAMVGQAPYVVNAGLTYASAGGATSATVLYNGVGKRVHSATEVDLPPVLERPRHAFDVSLRFPVLNRLSTKLDVKNVLDYRFEITQGAALRESYRSGRSFSAGISWRN